MMNDSYDEIPAILSSLPTSTALPFHGPRQQHLPGGRFLLPGRKFAVTFLLISLTATGEVSTMLMPDLEDPAGKLWSRRPVSCFTLLSPIHFASGTPLQPSYIR